MALFLDHTEVVIVHRLLSEEISVEHTADDGLPIIYTIKYSYHVLRIDVHVSAR